MKGLLLVLFAPAPSLEEEFNDWYDTEHLPERAELPGFETALRFVSLGDGPRYAAIYDLARFDVLDSEAYRAVSGENFSPWTRRIMSRSRSTRMTARLLSPGGAATGASPRLLVLKFLGASAGDAGQIETGLRQAWGSGKGPLRLRLFEGVEPAPPYVLALAEFASDRVPPLDLPSLGVQAERITLAATYRPYRG